MSSSISKWFWSWGYLAIALVVVFGVWLSKGADRENQNHVNPEVFTTFKQIEEACRAESFEKQSNKCTEIFKYQKECKLLNSHCNSRSFYEHLESLGFQLPRYFQEGFSPK